MRIVLLGPMGQVGWELQRALAPLGEVIALGRHGAMGREDLPDDLPNELCGDLTQPQAVARSIAQLQPQAIVNAAAYTAVDKAETERDLAFAINGRAVGVLAQAARDCGAWLVHYSTDYVFNGSGERPWRETDATAPVNTYGASKLAGEHAIAALHDRHIILRCSWVFEASGQNFLKTILRAAQQRDSLRVVADQWGAPTRAALIADVTAHALRTVLQADEARARDLAGLYHLSPRGETHWQAYAQRVVEQATRHGMALKVQPDAITGIPSADYPTPARRPHNSRMDASRLEQAFGLRLPQWQQGVDAVVAELAALSIRSA